jgi:hypothetical protein
LLRVQLEKRREEGERKELGGIKGGHTKAKKFTDILYYC